MKFIKNNKGYSLLIAIFALVIFAVIGLSLLTVTANGFKKNGSREDIVLATDLADKGVKYVVSDVQTKLENMIKTPMGKVTFSNELDKMFGYNSATQTLTTSALHCDPSNTKGIKIDSGTATNYTNVCIVNVEMIKTGGVVLEEDRYKRIVTFKSIGVVGDKVKETISKVIFGTDSIPDQLKYAVSSNTGGVHLYGGVEVRGDIKSAQDITLHNEGYLRSSPSLTFKSSVYPRLLPAANTVSPKLILPTDGSIYQLKDRSVVNTEDKILNLNVRNNLSKFNKLNLTSPDDSNYFQKVALFATPSANVVSRTLEGDNMEIANIIQEVYKKKTYNTFSKGNVTIGSSSNSSMLNKDKNHQYLIAKEESVRGDCKRTNRGRCEEYYYTTQLAKANLTINNKTLTMGGQYYINGDVTIDESTLNSDAILYVNGDVNITYSELKGKTADSTLIIFATGKIYLGNISNNSNTPSVVKGFFYSKSVVNLFGVMSNMELHGGISGKSIVLAGIRGKYTSTGSMDSVQNQQGVDANGVPKLNPRLKIIYDENLIQSYTSFKRDEEEEFITSVNDPEIVQRY